MENKEKYTKLLSNPKVITGPIIFIIVLGIFYFLSKNAKDKVRGLSNDLRLKENEVEGYLSSKKHIPTNSEFQWMQNRYKILKKLFSDILFALKSRQEDVSILKPLEFKEELLRYQGKLEKECEDLTFPKGFGFKDYLEEVVPREEELPDLTKEMYILFHLLKDELAKANVNNIIKIERNKKEKIFINVSENKDFYKVFSVYFQVETSFENLSVFINSLAYDDNYFFILDELKIEKTGVKKIKAEFVIRTVEFF